jgi:hypothetical protein
MANPTRTSEPDATPRVLVAIPYSRSVVVFWVASVVLPASYLIARAAGWLRPGGIGPGPVDPGRTFLLLAIAVVVPLLTVIGFRAPAFAVLKDGLKLPINRIAPGRLLWDPSAWGFYSWDELSYCRWSPHQPGVLSVHVGKAVHESPVVFGPMIYSYRVPARHRAAVEAAIRACGKWAD